MLANSAASLSDYGIQVLVGGEADCGTVPRPRNGRFQVPREVDFPFIKSSETFFPWLELLRRGV